MTSAAFGSWQSSSAPRSTPDSTSPLNTIAVSWRSLDATLAMPPPVPSGSSSNTYSICSPSLEPSPNSDSNTSALYDVPSTTCSMPASAMRDSRWVRNGKPAVGSIGLGADSVSGRSRVPWPPTRMTASTSAGFTGRSHVSAVLSPVAPRVADHETRARSERGLHRPPKRCLPPFRVPVCEESVGAGVVRRQVAGGVPAGRVTLVVQNLRRRHIDVLPAGLAEPITQVDVLHVHEVALVETADVIECGAAQQQAGSGQPADGTFAGLQPILAVGGRPRVGLPQRADHRVHSAADQARQVPRRRVHRAVGIADQRPERTRAGPPRGRVQQHVDTARTPLHVRVGDHEKIRVLELVQVFRDSAVHRGSIAQVGAGAQQPGVRVPLDRLLGAPSVDPLSAMITVTGRSVACDNDARNRSRCGPGEYVTVTTASSSLTA